MKKFIVFIVTAIVLMLTASATANANYSTDNESVIASITASETQYVSPIETSEVEYSAVSVSSETMAMVYAERWLKQQLKDPKSYDRISWKAKRDYGSDWIVYIKFRAKNSFGGYVISECLAVVKESYGDVEVTGVVQ